MKLLFLSHDSQYNGGAQKALVDLIKGLKRKYENIKIYIIFPAHGDLIDVCTPYIDGHIVISMKWWLISKKTVRRKRISFWIKTLFKTRSIKKYVQSIQPDYAITNTIVMPYLALACKGLALEHVWFIHEIPETWKERKFIWDEKKIYQIVERSSSKILVPSEFTKKFYEKNIPQNKLKVVTQAVEINKLMIQPLPKNEKYTILLVGGFDSNKGQMELLHAVKKITETKKDLLCYLVGADFGGLPICEAYIKENGLKENVVIKPFSNQIEQYYQLVDVLIVCSGFETFGRAAVEAQMFKIPVILSNVGANIERIQEGVTGLLYKKGDVDDLVDKIERLREEKTRKEFVRQIKDSDLEKYSPDSFATAFISIIASDERAN